MLRSTDLMAAIARGIEEDLCADHALKTLAAQAGLSEFHFLRLFKRVIGVTPHAFVRRARVKAAARLLGDPTLSIAAIAFEVGFQDLSAFNLAFRQVFDSSPRTMRARVLAP